MEREAYRDFARVYDVFMDNVDYDGWASYLAEILEEYGIRDGLVLELGCGTGTMTERLAAAGYDMIGVDNSEEMLAEAADKSADSGCSILYLCQDMREFELYGTVRAVVSVCDSLNYLTEDKDLEQVFSLVDNYLDPGGIFVFDVNTVYKYQELLGNSTIAENRDEGSFIWENEYDPDTGINIYELAIFLPRDDGLYEKSQEIHYQRAYSEEEIREALERSGLKLLGVYDAYTRKPPGKKSERLTFIAGECRKKRSPEAADTISADRREL